MDRTIKFLLGIVAASLVMLNLQLAGVEFVKEAAQLGIAVPGLDRDLCKLTPKLIIIITVIITAILYGEKRILKNA